jgi:hypothetical protein
MYPRGPTLNDIEHFGSEGRQTGVQSRTQSTRAITKNGEDRYHESNQPFLDNLAFLPHASLLAMCDLAFLLLLCRERFASSSFRRRMGTRMEEKIKHAAHYLVSLLPLTTWELENV